MSLELNLFQTNQPQYYHREYSNDIGRPKEDKVDKTWVDNAQRFGLVALPFISLYKPLSFPLSLATGSIRFFACGSQLIITIQQGNAKEIADQFFQTAIAVIALGATILAHPLGMLITTTHDILIELHSLISNLKEGKYGAAKLNCANILNNTLYFALFVHGGLEIGVASLAVQIFIGIYHSYDEFKKGGHKLEAAGHLAMSLIRGNQLRQQIHLLEHRYRIQKLVSQLTKTLDSLNEINAPKEIKTAAVVINPEKKTGNDLYKAILNDSKEGIRAAIDGGFNVNEQLVYGKDPLEDGRSPLVIAVLEKKPNAVEELLKQGSDPLPFYGLPGVDKESLVHHALRNSDFKSATMLVLAGASFENAHFEPPCFGERDLNPPKYGMALSDAYRAIQNSDPHLSEDGFLFLKALLDKGHPINCGDHQNAIYLLFYTLPKKNHEFLEILRVLIKRGANVNQAIRDQRNSIVTPLMLAKKDRNEDALKILLEAGAN